MFPVNWPNIWVWCCRDDGDKVVMLFDGEWGIWPHELMKPAWSSTSSGVASGGGKCKFVKSGNDPVLLDIGTCTDPQSSWEG